MGMLFGCVLQDDGQTNQITAYTGESVLLPCYCAELYTTSVRFSWLKPNTNRDVWEEISSESGCVLQDEWQTKDITAYTGESVLLPCYCAELYTTPVRFSWSKGNINTQEEISSESGQYRNRVQLVNGHSPANLSLLISNLTEEDGGSYQCNAEEHEYVYIILTVKGCTLENSGTTIAAHIGDSVLLPCYCIYLRAKPERFTWLKYNQSTTNWDRITFESSQYRNRVQLVNGHSPGNLSLLISHLTEEDGGDYKCNAMKSGLINIRVTVKATSVPDPATAYYSTADGDGSVSLQWRRRTIEQLLTTHMINRPPTDLYI
ncbi:cell surface A33 antigen-like [Colossoma macropomum]|uniref:cell surface A33 antigen-like n=1 Tax=Colossoma macropomum TaxID=42526 RepID=UPI00186436EB|nr:cell surface A33 antigen-like [Colossoma macropomum]